MKKFLKSLFSFLLIIPFAFMLAACKKDNNENKEFKEFSNAAVNIMSNYVQHEDSVATASRGSVEKSFTSQSSGDLEERLFTELRSYANAEVVSNVNYYYMDVMEQVFATTLGSGDVLVNKHKVKSFFGLKTKVIGTSEYGNQTEAFVVNKTNGVYVFKYYFKFDATSAMAESTERFAYATIDYKAIDDYKVTLLSFEKDFSNFMYAVADSDYNLSYVTKNTWEGDVSWLAVSAQGVLSCYETDEESLVSSYYEGFSDILDSQLNFEKYMADQTRLPAEAKYSVKEEDVYAAYERYVTRSASNVVPQQVAYIAMDGVVVNADLSYVNDTEEGVEILPTSAYAIDCNLRICPSVKKVLIPSNITKIVDKRYAYESLSLYMAYEKEPYGPQKDNYLSQYEALALEYESTKNDPKWEEWVEVSADYVKERFLLVQFEQREDGRDDPNSYYMDCEVDVAEGSTLFTKKADGNIYATVGGEEILVFINNHTIFEEEIDNVSLTFGDNGIRSVKDMVLKSHVEETTGAYPTNAIVRILANTKYPGDIFTKVKNVTITSVLPVNLNILALDNQYVVAERYNFDSVTVNLGVNAMLYIDPDIIATIGTLTINCGEASWIEVSSFGQSQATTIFVDTIAIVGVEKTVSISGSSLENGSITKDDSVTIIDNRNM